MAEASVRSSFPLAYTVDSFEDIAEPIYKAYVNKDGQRIKQLADQGDPLTYDLFVCINHSYHAFVLVVPANQPNTLAKQFLLHDDAVKSMDDPLEIPGVSLVRHFELRYKSESERMYKIAIKMEFFRDVEKKVKKYYYIGRYQGMTINGLQFAAFRTASKKHSVIQQDCYQSAEEAWKHGLAFWMI